MRTRKKCGYCHGEAHPRADLTSHEVELIRRLREVEGWTIPQIAQRMEKPVSTIQSICNYVSRVNG